MKHLAGSASAELTIRKSRFIALLYPAADVRQAKQQLAQVRRDHPGASHYCTALICPEAVRSSDDGEPAGTAGRPMLETLKQAAVEDVFAVVVRYFGGTLLGAANLARAYRDTLQLALQDASFTIPTKMTRYAITVGYPESGKLKGWLADHTRLEQREYGEQVRYTVLSAVPLEKPVSELTGGKALVISRETVTVEIPEQEAARG
jgi:uncharacterized YigZ family protein